jgi:hypothetical protein
VQWCDGVDAVEAAERLTVDTVRKSNGQRHPARSKAKTVSDYEAEQHRKAAWLWSQRRPVAPTIAETYLREVRGYAGPLPPTLAFLPPYKAEHHPALIAAFALAGEVEPGILVEPRYVEAVHLTLLRPDGSKADIPKPKIIVASPAGLPITLAPPNDLLGMAITEGIEDGLSVYASTGLGVWVAGAAGFMPALADMVPNFIECVTVYAHADPAGQRSATDLAERLHEHGFEVFVEGLP